MSVENIDKFVEYASNELGVDAATGDKSFAPSDEQQASQILRLANENGIPLGPQGSGTKLSWLSGDSPVYALSTTRMNSVVEHTWQDMTCTVQAGCTWDTLQSQLGKYGQFVALDPLWPDLATVGGVIASNDSGALRLRYGGLRDSLIGMTVVLADGTIAKSGGKVVKNVAGYDLPKLFCGSFGTLAFITDITFRLHSLPPHTQTFSMIAASVVTLERIMLQIMDRHFSLQSMQLRTVNKDVALDLRLMATESVISSQLKLLSELGPFVAEDDAVWETRQNLFKNYQNGFVFKLTTMSTEIASYIDAILNAGGEAAAQSIGILYGWLPQEASDLLKGLRSSTEAKSGSLTLLQGIAPGLDRWGKLPNSISLMREIKRRFDPNAILNPGRFLGGI